MQKVKMKLMKFVMLSYPLVVFIVSDQIGLECLDLMKAKVTSCFRYVHYFSKIIQLVFNVSFYKYYRI